MNKPEESPLGQSKVEYKSSYDPSLLFPIPRSVKREEIAIGKDLPFEGFDTWNAYEVSWLNNKAKPQVAILRCTIPCQSKNIIESKSFKLYLNSFNQTRFDSVEDVIKTIETDISNGCGEKVLVKILKQNEMSSFKISALPGKNLDDLDIECSDFMPDPKILKIKSQNVVEEELNSDLLKSNCLVTGQPDWGSIYIRYKGFEICHNSLLKFIVSFRNHNEFHEQCVERIFKAIWDECSPHKLLVQAFYTRRGGLDINPARGNGYSQFLDIRTARQ